MPIYEYQCTRCGYEMETLQGINEAPLKVCPKCSQSSLKKLISNTSFQLKGTGWYATDFSGKPKPKEASSETSSADKDAEKNSTGKNAKDDKNKDTKSSNQHTDANKKTTTSSDDSSAKGSSSSGHSSAASS